MTAIPKSRQRITLPVALAALAATAIHHGAGTLRGAEPFIVKDSAIATHDKTGVQVVKGTVELPLDLRWSSAPYAADDGLVEVYFSLGKKGIAGGGAEGTRQAKLNDRRVIRERRYEMNHVYYECQRYAREHFGMGPEKLADLVNVKPASAAGIHLLPGVLMMKKGANGRLNRLDTEKPLLVDTTPAIGDGKHWIINNRGTAERVEIDPVLMKKLGVTIVPQAAPHGERQKNAPTTRPVTIYARVTGELGKASLAIRDEYSKEVRTIEWDTSSAAKGDAAICNEWAEQRILAMDVFLKRDAPLSNIWAQRMVAQYHLEESIGQLHPELLASAEDPRFRGRTTNMMGMLGGRAAIQETLQLRNLRAQAENATNWMPSIPIGDIAGVKVAAHPFEEMLDGKPGGSLPLADWVPHDHFMAYLPQPEKIFSVLGGGSDFIFNAGSNMTGRSASYLLQDRYRESLGLSEDLMKRFLNSGAIEEIAVTVPDLFLIDGTEMSVVMRTGKPLLTTAALALIGVPPGDGQTVRKNRHGEAVYWLRRGDILIVSTNESELKALVEAKESGTGLGQSAELRYMLTQVPVTDETVVYSYFSDPFIRHVVGPQAKIGQLRRLLARAELEEASAGSLLAKFDGHGTNAATDLPLLQERGYIQRPVFANDVRLDQQSLSHSELYGSPARMNSLTDLDLERVSAQEKKAYDEYLDQYERYWRRYFDPIAVRYEQKGDGQHELETFILPLIENSLYGALRQFLPGPEEQIPLRVPVMEPQPIALVSCNLNESAWLGALEGFGDEFSQLLGLDPALLDLIGPDVHLAMQDADPIITLGNGELEGMLGNFGGDRSEMMWVTVLVSVITRPCTLHIGLEDPDKVRKLLSQMAWSAPGNSDIGGFGSGSLYQITGEERWIYKYSLEDIITLRFGIEVQDRYLVINNLPFSNQVKVTGSKRAPNGAAYVELNPAACMKQLPALFTSAAENLRGNTISGAACLMPLLAAGAEIESAQRRHRELFGFAPVHPGGGSWHWDPHHGPVSSLYGSAWNQRQPGFDPNNKAVGLLQGISNVNIGMQFEQDGLRSKVRWTTKQKQPEAGETN